MKKTLDNSTGMFKLTGLVPTQRLGHSLRTVIDIKLST